MKAEPRSKKNKMDLDALADRFGEWMDQEIEKGQPIGYGWEEALKFKMATEKQKSV